MTFFVRWPLQYKLHIAAGLDASRYRFSRLYVNGGYYRYAMEIEVNNWLFRFNKFVIIFRLVGW